MNIYKTLSLLLISSGILVMMVNIIKYQSTIRLAHSFLKKTKRPATRWYKIHHSLMILFLFGYITVLFSIIHDIRLSNNIFTSIIFILGAAFVLIGISLQSRMLHSIKKHHLRLIKKNEQLHQVEDATIYTLAYLAEIRDMETGKHIERTSQYVRLLVEELSEMPKYKKYITPKYIEDIVKSAPLHDIGKVGIPDNILKKTGKLTSQEFEKIRLHCQYGADILKIAEKKLTFESYLTLAIPLVMSHHEKWDGQGYPEGLQGDAIPLSAQIMAVADVYDALRSERCYKKAFSHEKSSSIIEEDKGKHFAPDVVDAFMQIQDSFRIISEQNNC